LASGTIKTAVFHDVGVLPYPKEAILRAFEREIIRERHEARVQRLKTGAMWLPCFQEGIAVHVNSDEPFSRYEAESNQISARIAAAVRLRKSPF
jgi:hypothetical protein